MKTLNLGLDEVAHIRSALTKAELEGIDDAVREDIENGRVRTMYLACPATYRVSRNLYDAGITSKLFVLQLCFLCKKARFGIFSRGSKCEMCKQSVCGKCQSKVRREERRAEG